MPHHAVRDVAQPCADYLGSHACFGPARRCRVPGIVRPEQVKTRWYYIINNGTPTSTGISCDSFHTLEVAASDLSVTLYIDGTSVATGTVTSNSFGTYFDAQNQDGSSTAPSLYIDWFAIKNPTSITLK